MAQTIFLPFTLQGDCETLLKKIDEDSEIKTTVRIIFLSLFLQGNCDSLAKKNEKDSDNKTLFKTLRDFVN